MPSPDTPDAGGWFGQAEANDRDRPPVPELPPPRDPAAAAFAAVAAAPPPGSRWQHRKGGRYTVTGAAVVEATLTPAVVYADATGRQWVRPLTEFLDGRFRRIVDDPRPGPG